jgi:hypothetical protein
MSAIADTIFRRKIDDQSLPIDDQSLPIDDQSLPIDDQLLPVDDQLLPNDYRLQPTAFPNFPLAKIYDTIFFLLQIARQNHTSKQ